MPGIFRTPVVVLEATDCAAIADVLAGALADARARNEPVPPRVEAIVAMVGELAAAHRSGAVLPGTSEYRTVDHVDTAAVEWVSVAAAAQITGTSPRNIRARCERGTVRAEKVGETWRIDRAALRSA